MRKALWTFLALAGSLLLAPTALAAPGDLLVGNYTVDNIRSFSPNGTDQGTFALANAWHMKFGPDGLLYTAESHTGGVRRFSPTGTDLGFFVPANAPVSEAIAFDAVGNLYVSGTHYNSSAHSDDYAIYKYSTTGASLGIFASGPQRGTSSSAVRLGISSNCPLPASISRHSCWATRADRTGASPRAHRLGSLTS